MDELSDISCKLKIPTNEITSDIVQFVLVQAKRHSNSKEQREEWDDIAELLWKHLENGLNKYDDQLLCATCLFSVLPLTVNPDHYLDRILLTIKNELDQRAKNNEDIKNNSKITEVVSIIYGLFQSAFLTQKTSEDLTCMGDILNSSFDLLLLLAYEYSRFTFLAFKTIGSFKKVFGTTFQKHIFHTNGQIQLLNLVNHNWENPITGVRDLNRGIFHMVISTITEDMYKVIVTEINSFYWNKAKYLMLSEIIEQSKTIPEDVKHYDWVDGLMYSLHKPGLVSAGADMYYAILKKLKSDNEWCDLFLKGIIKILTSGNSKAIENYTNYWCLTTFKKFPSLATTLIMELELTDSSENNMYSSISLLKQANKMGLLQKDLNTRQTVFPKSMVHCAVENSNPVIRIQAFDVLCVSQSKSMPQEAEYAVILNYLQDNVNSDCTVLRLGMLNSLNSFLSRLQSTFMTRACSDIDVDELISFCMALQKIIKNNLILGGNYQRKITTIKLCKLIQDCFTNPPRKMQNQGSRSKALTLTQMLKENNRWILDDKTFIMKLLSLLNDPSDDIRENVIQLLLSHYSQEFKYPLLLNYVINDALINMKSKFFYEINCGRSMFKLITNILLIEESSADFKTVEEVFLFAYNELESEYKMKTDVVKSIENGKQLHSLMIILHVVLEVCHQNSYKITCLDEHFADLVAILDGISNQFAWEDTSTSSDFSKMSDMVQNMIASSGHDSSAEADETKISGLHQMVLNCLWLNVKVSCDLASLLIQFTEDNDVINRCLKIITRVLETCRHKGAIEAAGAAIGRAIQYLTSLPEGSTLQQLPYTLLKSKLTDLISEAGTMSSITRRGAGLSIMVHRIVSSDMKKGKPLFHYFMETLLETCNKVEDIPASSDETTIDNQKDLPKAIYIHFMTRIVTDSSLASDMMYYSAKLAALAFGNLTSPRWQIRNAALQLYGALIPKLIGQKKASGSDDETVATVACDEFRTHSPALWKHVTQSLEANCTSDDVQAHSNLVPVLNILGTIARRYNFSFDIEAQKKSDERLLNSLILLLKSPLYTIRRLSAKCIFNIFSFEVVCEVILKQDVKSENFLNGILMLLTIYHKKEQLHQNVTTQLKEKIERIINTGKHSYLCRQIFEDMFSDDMFDVEKTLSETKSYAYSPGVHLWAERRIEKYLINIPWKIVPEILETLLDNHCEQYGSFLLTKLKSDHNIPTEILVKISEQLLAFSPKYSSTVIWELLYEISLKEKLTSINVKEILKNITENNVPYKLRFAIPLAARESTDVFDVKSLSEIILNLSDPESTDTDMRYIAAMANNEIALTFQKLPDGLKINAITSAVILLQDEDEDIRSLIVEFYKNIKGGQFLNPYICLRKILSYEFFNSVLQKPMEGIETLCVKLSKIFVVKSSDVNEYNPFANDSKNIYCEAKVIRQFIENLR